MPALIYMHINSSHRWLHQIHTMCNSVICARGLWGRSKHLHEATKLHHQHAHFCFLQMFVNCFIAEVLFTVNPPRMFLILGGLPDRTWHVTLIHQMAAEPYIYEG